MAASLFRTVLNKVTVNMGHWGREVAQGVELLAMHACDLSLLSRVRGGRRGSAPASGPPHVVHMWFTCGSYVHL